MSLFTLPGNNLGKKSASVFRMRSSVKCSENAGFSLKGQKNLVESAPFYLKCALFVILLDWPYFLDYSVITGVF